MSINLQRSSKTTETCRCIQRIYRTISILRHSAVRFRKTNTTSNSSRCRQHSNYNKIKFNRSIRSIILKINTLSRLLRGWSTTIPAIVTITYTQAKWCCRSSSSNINSSFCNNNSNNSSSSTYNIRITHNCFNSILNTNCSTISILSLRIIIYSIRLQHLHFLNRLFIL